MTRGGLPMLTIPGRARLISDLHLRAERPDITGRFLRFVDATAGDGCSALFILGDLFEYWIGDDDLAAPLNASVAAALQHASQHGLACYFIAGNRDFLLGPGFTAASGLTLLADSSIVSLGGTPTLLLHGDTLCTDDLPYQQFRQLVRGAEWQRQFLARPLAERQAEVAKLRQRSAEAMQAKSAAIMDANPQAIRAALTGHQCSRLIHGHTHRPGHDQIAGGGERWVLSDWDTARGDALEIDAQGVRRIALTD